MSHQTGGGSFSLERESQPNDKRQQEHKYNDLVPLLSFRVQPKHRKELKDDLDHFFLIIKVIFRFLWLGDGHFPGRGDGRGGPDLNIYNTGFKIN